MIYNFMPDKKSRIIKLVFFIALFLVLFFVLSCNAGQNEEEEGDVCIPGGVGNGDETGTTEICEEELLWGGLEPKEITEVAPRVGFLAPPFSLEDINGNEINLNDYCGKHLFVVFWHLDCDTCENVLTLMEEVHVSDELITVIAINVRDDADLLLPYVRDRMYSFPILLDREGVVFKEYQLNSFPATIAINGRREIVLIWSGFINEEELVKIRRILLDWWELEPIIK